jgi:hypothetical protein
MIDTLDTAQSHGLVPRSAATPPAGAPEIDDVVSDDFNRLTNAWTPLTLALNSLNRSMGLQDAYPFVVSETVRGKLHFVHQTIRSQGTSTAISA